MGLDSHQLADTIEQTRHDPFQIQPLKHTLFMKKAGPDARWDRSLALIRENVTEQIYNTWFKPIDFVRYDEQTKTVQVAVPSPFQGA